MFDRVSMHLDRAIFGAQAPAPPPPLPLCPASHQGLLPGIGVHCAQCHLYPAMFNDHVQTWLALRCILLLQWLAVGSWSPLAVGSGWRLAVGGGWRLAVDGPLGRSLTKKNLVP